MVPFPPWAFSVILSMMLATVAIVFAIKKKIFSRRESSKQRADPAVVDDMITPAEIDYSELQRNLDKGVHALDNVRENVQTLFFGVHGAQVLHSEVENCVSALAEELDLTSSSEATVSELEKLLENETRNRWALRIAHEKELKSVNAKLATLETALLVAREQYEQNLADQEKAFDVILREKNDEIGILDATSSEQKRLLSDLQMTSEQMKLDLASLKDASIECDKLAESVSLSAKSQEDLKRQLEMAQAEFNMKTEEYVKLSSELANVKDSLLLTESTIERLKSEKEYILSESNGIQEKSNLLQAELDSLKNELVDKEKVSVDLELKLAENAALQSQLDEALTRTHQLKIELSISSDERSKLLDQLTELRSLRNEASDISPSDLCNLRLDYENLNNENKTLQDAIERLRYELKTKVDDLAHKDSALHEALSQAEQYRSEQKKLTDTQLEISVIEAEERIRELQLEHDQDICQLKQEHLDAIGKLNLDHQNVLQKLLETHREEAAGLKLEVLEANQTIGQLQENIVQLNSDLNLLQESVTSSEKNHVEQRLELEQHISSLKAEIVQMECNWTDEKVALEKAFSERVCSENRSLQSKVQKLQQENCILSNALLEETSKQKSVLDELEQSRRLSDVLKSQYESLRQEEERETISRIDIALQQKSFEFETSINELVQNYENQIAELNEKLDSLSSLDQDAQERERAFTETLQESLAAVNRSKDSEIASIHQDYLKKLATKDAASDAARLDFQSKLEAANKSLDQQAKSFENRLKAELEAQTLCSSKRLEFAENTISKLQDELQACRTVINNLNAEVKISKFKADGAGVLLDRVHSYKTQLACSDQKKSELLQLLNNRDKDLQRLNAKVRDQEIVISHFENAIQEYEIEFKNHVETINLLHSTYTSKLLNLEACIDRMEEQRLGSSSSNEQKLREEIDQLKLSVDQHQMDFRAFLEDFEQSSLKTIYDSFKEEKASILASKDELTKALVEKSAKLEELQAAMDSKGKEITALKSEFDDKLAHLQRQTDLERQSYAKDALESLKKQHKLELKELEAANQSDLALMEKARAEERQIYAKQLNEALESLKKQHKLELQELEATNQSEQLLLIEKVRTEERQSYAKELNEALESLKKQHKLELQELEAANQSEQLVSIEKARTEAAAEWQSLRDKTEATWKEKLRIAVETARSTNATAILNAIECERRSSERRYQTELKEQAELFEKRRADIDSAWQCKLDEASCAIESLQTRLDQLDRFHKPKSRAPLGERDPLTGSRPGSSSNGSVSKKSKGVSKENAPTNQEVHQPGPGSETTKSVSSRGSRSRSRRDSFGYRYWKASDFHLRSELGQGTYGTHYLAIEHKTSTQYAINRISRRKVEKTNSADTLIRRIELMGQLTHPYLRRMLGSFEDDRWIYIVQEYIPNSKPLSVHLQDLVRKKYVFPPSDVAFLVSCLANVLDYIHGKGIVHCQVSVDKVLLTSNGVPKLSGPTVGLNNLPVLPPEHLSADDSAPSLSWAVDSWSLGVLSFTLLVGRVPFTVEDNVIDVNKVANEEPVFSSHSDPLAKSLIENLLCKDPSQRLRMSQVLQHPFILHYQKKEPLTTIREDQRL